MVSLKLENLKEQFGTELFIEIIENIVLCNEKNMNYTLEIISENKYYTKIALISNYHAWIYEIDNEKKKIYESSQIGSFICNRILEVMTELNEKQKKSSNVPA